MALSIADPTGIVDVYQAFDQGLCTRNKPFPGGSWVTPQGTGFATGSATGCGSCDSCYVENKDAIAIARSRGSPKRFCGKQCGPQACRLFSYKGLYGEAAVRAAAADSDARMEVREMAVRGLGLGHALEEANITGTPN